MIVYVLRETDGIDEWIIGVFATRTLAEDEKFNLQKVPKEDIAIYGITQHEVIGLQI